MISPEQKKFFTGSLPFWGKLTSSEQESLINSVTEQKFEEGSSLHNGPDDCSGLFLVEKGQVRVYIISESGKEITLYRLLDHDICLFSASCILKNINFDVYAQAEKDTVALLIPTKTYKVLSKSSLPVADFTAQLVSSRFSDVMWVMEQVLFVKMDKRLANFLVEQSALDDSNNIAMTHETIARHLGTAREVITRMLKYFQSEGIVSLSRGGIKIIDKPKLIEFTV